MNVSQLTLELQSLRQDYNQYRVEMASRLDDLERRLEIAETALARDGSYGMDLPPMPPSGLRPTGSGSRSDAVFAEHRCLAQPPPPLHPAPALSPAFASPNHSATTYGHPQQAPRAGGRPPKKMGSAENAGYLPYAIEKIAAAAQKKSVEDTRTW